MNTIYVMFALAIIVPALALCVAVWWMYRSPAHRPEKHQTDRVSLSTTSRVLFGLGLIVLLVFGLANAGF